MMSLLEIEFGLKPEYKPRGIPRKIVRKREAKASSSVAGMRSAINFSADSLNLKDLPKSPWTAFARNFPYCA